MPMKLTNFRIVLSLSVLTGTPWLCPAQVSPAEGANSATSSSVPNLPEMPTSSVVEVFLNEAPAMGIAPPDADHMGNWLRRVLAHSHQRIDQLSLGRFRKSLKAFDNNSGADFRQHHNESMILLEFCCDMGWGRPLDSVDSDTLLKQYRELGDNVIGQIKAGIEATVPSEKKNQWMGQVEAKMKKVQEQLDSDIEEWSNDFLFPGFKEPLSKSDQAKAKGLAETGGGKDLMPRYGAIAKLMQTRDESFQWQLDNFSQYFGALYGDTLCFHQILARIVRNKYWSHYDLSTQGSDHGWPIVFSLSPQVTAQPAVGDGH